MKTIFGTTEKSNFILNMKTATLNKYINILLAVCAFLPVIGGFAWLMTDYATYVPAITLMLGGFVAVLLYLVCLLKKETIFTQNISGFFALGIALLAIISNMGARNVTVSTFGNTGRYEGILALFSYLGIFFLASVMSGSVNMKKILKLLVIIGLFQSFVGILQMIPAINFPSKFQQLYSSPLDNINLFTGNEGAFLPGGTAGSPIFLALLLTMFFGIALAGACYETKNKAKAFYYISAVIMGAVALCTQTIISVLGIGAVLLTMGIIELVRIMKKAPAPKTKYKPILVWLAVLIVMTMIFLLLGLSGNYGLKDVAILYQDSYYNLFITGNMPITDTVSYPHLWGETADIIKMYPFFGTGLDSLFIPQMHGNDITAVKNSFEKCLNDYLYIAATRGIPALIAYLGLLAVSIKKAFGGLKQFLTESEEWYKAAIAVSIVGYAVAIFFGVSGIMVAPYFFLLLGLANAKRAEK